MPSLKLYEVSYDLQFMKRLWPAKEYIVAESAKHASAAFRREQAWRELTPEYHGRAIHVEYRQVDLNESEEVL